jgi:hypothetical protein
MFRKPLISLILIVVLSTIISSIGLAAEDAVIDRVDLGSAGNENTSHQLSGWGRSATDETGGTYGGIGPGGCRLVWDGETDGPESYFTLNASGGSAEYLVIQHLDGQADESYDVHFKNDSGQWVRVGFYRNQYSSETWVTTVFFLSGFELTGVHEIEFKITATGPKWAEFPTYGQLCVDWIELQGIEGPGGGNGDDEFCDYEFKPPVNLEGHAVNVRATLPIKFFLSDCDGNPVRGQDEPELVVHYLGDGENPGGDTFTPELKRGTGGYQFLALFRPEATGKYEAVITYEGSQWKQAFDVVGHGNSTEKPQAEGKLTGKEKEKSVKPEKPETRTEEKKPKGKPIDNPGKGKGKEKGNNKP